jgi:hypothetical protein
MLWSVTEEDEEDHGKIVSPLFGNQIIDQLWAKSHNLS